MFRINKFLFRAYVSIFSLVCLVSFSEGALEPWASNTQPSDVAKSTTVNIASNNFQYMVTQGGYMDGENCRTPISVAMDGTDSIPIEKTWESNRLVKMENTGTNDLVNPWLSNGRNNFRNMTEIINAAITGGMTEKEKALALYWQEIKYRCHRDGDDNEAGIPVKLFNVYGQNTCGTDSNVLASLWKAAGFTKVQPAHLLGHGISQAYFDGRLNLMDGDQDVLILLRDNETIANEQEIVRDPDLAKRTHTRGILYSDNRWADESYAAEFVYDGQPEGDRGNIYTTNMNMTLRPNEAITWRWGVLTPIKYHGSSWAIPSQYVICNGLWEYFPDFTNDAVWRNGALSVSNITNTAGTLTSTSGTGVIVWKISSPYVIVGGSLTVTGSGYTLSISWDNSAWTTLSGNNLDSQFSASGTARYTYYLRCQLAGSAQLTALSILNDIQMSGLVLPGMIVGSNAFTYTDENTVGRSVRITHEWVERNISRPPNAPASPIYPADGGDSDGTQFAFRWNVPADPDGDAISDYQFELSERSDMKYPLSPNFYKLISKTSDSGKAQYTLPYSGMLTPDKTYYWHVKAKDNKGVWGAWSNTWSFIARGPAYPINVIMDTTTVVGKGTLKWSVNSVGRAPAKYRVYGSDEKGFTISDTTYTVVTGGTSGLTNPFPSNFVCETTSTQLDVLGAGLALPNTNKAYYRVIAVDSNDKRSWSSDYASAPRPFIYSVPVTTAQAGQQYQYQVSTIRSIGDLRARTNNVTRKFWDIEAPKFTLQQAPDWLTIDENTGLITGMPGIGGPVTVSVTLERDVPQLDPPKLAWGIEQVNSITHLVLGPVTQEFTINAGTITDPTPPSVVTQVLDGTSLSDEEVTNSALQLSANWTAASDPESGVYYKYAIGTTAGASDVVNWTYSSTTTVTKTGLSLTNGQRYYFSVYAKNGAGMQSQACNSNGILVLKAPTIFTDNFDGWTAKPGPWDSVAGENSLHIISTTTEQNESGGSCLKVVDNASSGYEGAYMEKAFDPGLSEDVYVRFFFYYPTGFAATGGSRTLAQLLTTDGQTIYICTYGGTLKPFLTDSVSWALATWPGSDLSESQWYCYETHLGAPSASTTFEFWVDGATCTARLTGKNFGTGTWDTLKFGDVYNLWNPETTGTFYLDELVVADHYIGPSISTAQTTDTTPPSNVSAVRDGTGTDISRTGSLTSLSANWNAATDSESRISGYKYAIGTTAGNTDVAGWATIGNVLTVTKTGLTLNAGTTYYFSVKAINNASPSHLESANTTNSDGQYGTDKQATVYWKFDEGTGSSVGDNSGSGNTGVLNGSPNWTTGQVSGGISLDGTEDTITCNTLPLTKDNFTMCAWVQATATHEIDSENTSGYSGTSGQKYLFWAAHGGTNAGVGVSVGTNGISVYEHGAAYMPPLAVYSGTLGTGWNHIVVVYENKQPKIYLNGALVKTGLTSTKSEVYVSTTIGGGAYGMFYGTVDEVRIYPVSLMSQEVLALYNSYMPPTAPSTVRDGTSATADIDSTMLITQLSANWYSPADSESGIAKYYFAIGTTAGASNITGWTDNGSLTNVTKTGLTLVEGVTYYFSVKAENGVGLQSSTTTSNGQWASNQQLVISDVAITNITENSVTITWITNKPADSHAEYGVTAVYGQQLTAGSGLVTSHSMDITGLTQGTTYHYRVKSDDGAGHLGIGTDSTFVTARNEIITPQPNINAYPNPCDFREGRVMKFGVQSSEFGEVKIYTLTGKLVRKVQGTGEITWDGTNEDGGKVTRGIYIYRISASNGDVTTGKLAVK